jgi:hypothetical protein
MTGTVLLQRRISREFHRFRGLQAALLPEPADYDPTL